MIYGITKCECTCMCACEFPESDREQVPEFNSGIEALFSTEIEAIRWAAATRQRKAHQLGLPFTALGREVRHTSQGWLATISWNE